MVPCAYLRAFEPLDRLPAATRRRWIEYINGGRRITATRVVEAEARLAAVRVLRRRVPPAPEVALVRRVGDRIHVCPVDLELRNALALVDFVRMLPPEAVGAFVTAEELQRAVELTRDSPEVPHIREASWAVPLHWFVLFDPAERHYVDPPEAARPRLVYLTTAAAAVRRLEHAITVVDDATPDNDVALNLLAELDDWLESFDGGSIIELDYGGLVEVIPRPLLATDRTCEDVWTALERLADGDLLGAVAAYGAANARWAPWAHTQHHN